MQFISLAIIQASGFAAVCFLVTNGHPWFAGFMLAGLALMSARTVHVADDGNKTDRGGIGIG